jgi:fatty-acyl-CoA synthase
MGFAGLGTWVERRAARSPSSIALVTPDASRSYADLAREIRAAATMLRERGIGVGDRVAFHGGNHPSALVSLFATTAIGAVWVPIHPARPEDEVLSVLRDSDARLLIRASPATHPDAGVPEVEATEFDGFTADGREAWPAWEAASDDLAILAYTSGTTGLPKGVMLSHGNVLWDVIQMVTECSFGPADVTLAAAPFTRMGGLGVTVLPTLFAGGTVVVPPGADGPAVLDTIERSRVTVVFANPDLLQEMMRAPGWEDADLSSVRTGVVGGGLAPEALIRAFLDRGVPLLHGYGLTEAAPIVSLLPAQDAATRTGSVGRPMPFVEVRSVRSDGSICGPGEVGEWWIRGPNVSAGYWRRAPVRDADGWFPTGDIGVIDADGYLTFIDRASSVRRVGDVAVYPATIERALYGAPGLVDVAAVDVDGCIVVGVVADAAIDPDDLLPVVSASVAPHDVPHEVGLLTEIPRNAAGKVRRDALRELLTDR